MQLQLSLILPCLLAAASSTSYTEDYRPQYHFTPAKNWMNDPNGLIYHKGKYHMYFQYNPTGDVWGNISWGHAVSDDLMRWKELPIALNAFDSPAGSLNELYFSGSAVSDDAMTSGLGHGKRPPLVAVYTSSYTSDLTLPSNKTVRTGQQSQSIAFSTDNGLSWTEYPDNPVILEPPSQYADQYLNFRDPFVFWYEPSKHWVMTVSLPNLHKLLIYTSKNLTAWEHVSEFGPVNAVGGQWECPSLFQLPVDGNKSRTKWVMVIGLNPGGPAHAGGSGTQYVVGTFDGTTFTADANNVYDASAPEESVVFEDWNEASFAESSWKATGDFVEQGPSNGQVLTLWEKGDKTVGSLSSKKFTVSKKHIAFKIGCCNNPYNPETYGTPADQETAINLIVDGQVVRSTTGVNGGDVIWASWNVANLIGKTAYIQLVDRATGGWGHLDVGEIVFTDKPLPPRANWVDYGPDYYAAATYNGLSNYERVAVAWMNDWAYAVDIPTSPWRSAMSIPRVLTLETVDGRARLIQKPHPNLKALESRRMLYKKQWGSTRTGNLTLPVSGKALDITLTFAAGKEAKMLGLNVRTDGSKYGTAIGYEFDTNEMFVNRESSGDSSFSAAFPGVYYAPLPIRDGKVELRILLDWSSVEVFGGSGEEAITAQIFPPDSSTGVSLFSVGVVKDVKIEVHSVSSAWRGSYN
ncbi:hypothetical protein FNYG_12953 [Fusarium nygamai]|uniref:Glycosyl hydrolase family 32 N-terminal domain-containing protein n=1 Tax=Gibberella nygamai TaxID=42673 RepID=A0A2K0VUS1_GIBNY|nr:hypothetical protein FNYG_12953 [Fusarium nygamai]